MKRAHETPSTKRVLTKILLAFVLVLFERTKHCSRLQNISTKRSETLHKTPFALVLVGLGALETHPQNAPRTPLQNTPKNALRLGCLRNDSTPGLGIGWSWFTGNGSKRSTKRLNETLFVLVLVGLGLG